MDDVNILSIEIIDFLIYLEVIIGRKVLSFKKRGKYSEKNTQPLMILQ